MQSIFLAHIKTGGSGRASPLGFGSAHYQYLHLNFVKKHYYYFFEKIIN